MHKNLATLGLVLAGLLLAACEPIQFPATAIEDYETARKIFWQELYAGENRTLYCDDVVNSQQRKGFNVEHVFPMSWVTNAIDCGSRKQCRASSTMFNRIEADLHNLYPVRSAVNSSRASFRFGEVRGESRRYGESCDFEVNRYARVAEPRPQVRGDVARAMFFMAWKYQAQGLELFKRSGELLQEWHNQDPPDETERRRSLRISELQGDENIFVTEPEKLNTLISSGFFY